MKIIIPEPVTSKQLEILLLLYRFRFLNRIHIQTFLKHKNHTRITPWLKDLTDRNIISRIYSQTIGNINKPAIYYLAVKSKHILEKNEKCNPSLLKRVYREKQSSPTFRDHWLFMADLYFHFLKIVEQQDTKLHFYTTTDLSTFQYLPLPLPDAYIAVQNNEETKRYFLEVIDGNERWFAVDRRIMQYISYYKGNYWQSHVDYPFPKILIICPHTKLKKHLQRFIRERLEAEEADIEFFLSIQADIQKNGIINDTWEVG